MADTRMQRKLRAIFSADVKGYSKLMGDDDEHTINTITAYREIITKLIEAHHGSVVDAPGDNILAEFSGALNAVNSAVEIQRTLETENGKLPDNRRMEFRIGINLGDILHKDDRIYGDGVNVAARIESLADPGGICISRGVFDQVKKKVLHGFEYLGERAVKNISNPVRIYKILTKPQYAGKVIGEKRFLGRMSRKLAMSAILTLAIVTGGLISYYIYLHQSGRIEPAVVGKMAHSLPELPSIAVLPFDNMSGDTQQDYLSDGITEQIIASLSKVPYLFVISRNSTFTYKGNPVKVNQVAEDLGVRYVLEGSVQRSEDHLRITVQLIDAIAGHHIWSEKYDRQIKDIFALQDEIAMKIMAELQVKISVADMGRLSLIKTKNIKAYEKFLKAWEYYWRRTEADILQAKKLAQETIELDPEYGDAYLLLGWTHLDDIWFYRTKSREKSLETAEQFAQKAISLSADEAAGHRLLASIYMLRKEYENAIVESQRSVDLAPNSATANFVFGMVLRNAGRYDDAIPYLEKAIRLEPITPVNFLNNLALAYAYSGQYEKALPLWTKAIEKNPDYLFAYQGLTWAHQLLGNRDRAKKFAAEVLRIKPTFTIAKFQNNIPAMNETERARIINAYREAGIPEK
ncbi:adenylate/guanylate cyclase domain-containing protein [Desulfosarcina sp.]|uniref:adenylate/guanylate cyclase domain-containing protein n=1 Tax=Desulfosarcina sp. TaxID=2027861 RepID=UPI0035687A08